MDKPKSGKCLGKNRFKNAELSESDKLVLENMHRQFSEAVKNRMEQQEMMKALIEADEYRRAEPNRMVKKAISDSRLPVKNPRKKKIVIILDKEGMLYAKGNPKLKTDISRAPLKKRVLLVLRPHSIQTRELLRLSAAKTLDAFYQSVQSINRVCTNVLKLKKGLIANERGSYRINPVYELIVLGV